MGRKKNSRINGQLDLFSILAAPAAPVAQTTPATEKATVQPAAQMSLLGMLQATQAAPHIEPASKAEEQSAPVLSLVPAKAEEKPLKNYRLPQDTAYATTPLARYQDNVAAIRLLKSIESGEETIRPEKQAALAKFTGWGGLADFFDEKKQPARAEALKTLLDEKEYAAARRSVLSAFYTPALLITEMWKTLTRFGFKAGNVLEPSCGTGRFLGLAPESENIRLYGVELDSLSARIAAQIYPRASMLNGGFETASYDDNFFDVVIGNVPFGEYGVSDTRYDREHLKIHDYFIVRGLDLLRPGGVMAVIVSKYFMDKADDHVRKLVSTKANLVGAVRLPEDAFPGTRTVADMLFFQKIGGDTKPEEADWLTLDHIGGDIPVNTYFAKHPEMLLGKLVWDSRYDGHSVTTVLTQAGWESRLAERLQWLHAYLPKLETLQVGEKSERGVEMLIPAKPGVRNFTFTLLNGKIYYRRDALMELRPFGGKNKTAMKDYLALRDAVHAVLDAQMEDLDDGIIKARQKKMSRLYDDFVLFHRALSSRSNAIRFREDADYPLMASMEITQPDGSVKKASIFTERTIRRHQIVTHVDTAMEALPISLNARGGVDIPYICRLTGKDEQQVLEELRGTAIFRDPQTEKWVTADEYLSGNVRKKLRAAQTAVSSDAVYAVNVEALEKAQPEDIPAADIDLRLGAVWIDAKYITQFIREVINPPAYAKNDMFAMFTRQNATWHIEGKQYDRSSVTATKTYGTDRMTAYEIIEDTLNLKDVKVYDYVTNEKGNKVARVNKEDTIAAQAKQAEIKDAFREWVFNDPVRRADLVRTYNERFNSIRLRAFDGSYLTFPGMADGIALRPHQKNAVARAIFSPNTLLAHVVGAGKTFTMAAAAMEMKRLGIVSKPMFVVPNHLIEQWGAEFLRLYPSANILLATKDDFEKSRRRAFCARMATGNYDAIIIGHSAFGKIPVSDALLQRHMDAQMSEILDAIAEAKSDSNSRYTVRQLEIDKARLEKKQEKLHNRKARDYGVTFEETGVDYLFIDESHYFKNLFLYTKMRNIAGIAQTEAQKSSDLYMKIQYLQALHNGRAATFATGTPVSNSMTELYTVQRYLQPEALKEAGMEHFDCWASTFGETVTAIELAPEGTGWRSKQRFARFYNLPELMRMFRNIADIQTADMLKLPVPALKGGKIQNIETPASEIQKQAVQDLADRAAAVRDKLVDPSEDNMLKITTDGRALALDQRLLTPDAPDYPQSKVNVCARKIYEIWKETTAGRSAQMVFCDQSTPHYDGSFNVYDDLKTKLVHMGIPADEVAFIHDAKTDAQKDALFAAVRAGRVRVLIGSTFKMGAGTNCQDRLIAEHHLDVPWRPADLEQRQGRILRQGNLNAEVWIFRYVTAGTFDAYSWQLIENKQRFISQIMVGKSTVRSADDIDEAALSFAEVKALATGNPLFKEKMDVDVQLNRLQVLEASYRKTKYRLEDNVTRYYPAEIKKLNDEIAVYLQDIARRDSAAQNHFSVELFGRTYLSQEEAEVAIRHAMRNFDNEKGVKVGSYSGFDILMVWNVFGQRVHLKLRGAAEYDIIASKTDSDNLEQLFAQADGIENLIAHNKERIAAFRQRIGQEKAELAKPFAYQAQLDTLKKRQAELNAQLNMDKTDNALDMEATA